MVLWFELRIMKTADELTASVDATLNGWNKLLSGKKGTVALDTAAAASTAECDDNNNDNKKKIYLWEDGESYVKRLATFKPDTYFAKPLAISPLVCAAFGWENTGKDIIKCPHCNATLCIKFHHALDQESKANLCSKYLDLLASSHKDVCPFQSFAKRSLKVMQRQRKTNNSSVVVSDSDEHNVNHDPASLMDRVEMALKKSTVDLFVPPYMLPLCNEMKMFEDYACDGSVTKQSVEDDAVKIQSQIDARGSVIGVEIPNAVTTYCREVLSDPATFDKSQKTSRDAYLSSAFGWSICDDKNGAAEGNNMMGILLKCKMCLARSILAATPANGESPKKKKRRVDSANIKLLDSHRVYCPYVSGFASGDGYQSEPGWKVVLSKLQ